MKVYVVYDAKSEMAAGGLQLFKSDAPAIRRFSDYVLSPDSILAKHPADFSLRWIADFDEDTCQIRPVDPALISTAESVLAAVEASKEAR